MPSIRVALAQIAPKLGLTQANLAAHLTLLGQAREQGIELLVFPELSLMGYQLKDLANELALPVGELCSAFSGLGRGPAIEVVVGFMERAESGPATNSQAHLRLDEHGRATLLHVHQKLNLPTYGMFEEERFFAKGHTLRAYDSPLLGRSGMLICEDLWHPANPLILALDGPGLHGARVLIVASDSPARGVLGLDRSEPENAEKWDLLARYTALTCNCAVLVAQRVGVEDGLVFTGGSEIVLPGGQLLARAALFSEELLVGDLPLEVSLKRQRATPFAGPEEDFERLRRELLRIGRRYLED